MSKHNHRIVRHTKHRSWILFILWGLASLLWFIIRTGKKPSRIQYPCQKIAATTSITFLSWLASVTGAHILFRQSKQYRRKLIFLTFLVIIVFSGIKSYQVLISNLRPKIIWGQAAASRVVWVTRADATTGSYDPNNGNQTVINNMMDDALLALTGETTVAAAWTDIFMTHNGGVDYQSGEKIAIKVNFNNSHDCTNNGCPLYKVVIALLRQLVNDRGINQPDIGLYDVSRTFPSYFTSGISASFPNVQLNPDRDTWPPCTASENVLGSPFSCWLTDAKYLINMPLLRTHGAAGITLSLKNHLGSGTAPANFHGNFFTTSPSENSLVLLNNHPFIKDKHIMSIADALYGLQSGGPGGFPNIQPNSIFISRDAVAVDSVMTDYIDSLPSYFNSDARIPYQVAASIGLGNYATSCSSGVCSFEYANIDLVRCDPNCPGTTPIPSTSPSPTLDPSPAPSSSPDPIAGILIILANWGGSGEGDFNDDGKVNGLDFGWVLAN